jgi:RNase P/RNase MRP subunit POP5
LLLCLNARSSRVIFVLEALGLLESFATKRVALCLGRRQGTIKQNPILPPWLQKKKKEPQKILSYDI